MKSVLEKKSGMKFDLKTSNMHDASIDT